jgi:hypothetical protein
MACTEQATRAGISGRYAGPADIVSTESKMHQQAVIWAVHQFFVLLRFGVG